MSHNFRTAPWPARTHQRLSTGAASDATCRTCSLRSLVGYDSGARIPARLFLTAALLAISIPLLPADGKAQVNLPQIPPAATESVGFDRRESVLDRMREFKGEKTREALAALFVRMDPAFSQEPSVLLSDGSTTARITLRVPYRKGETPKFSISGGHCVTVRAADNSVWILEILPDLGSMETSITVLSGGSMTEYPLTVAPPLNLLDPRKAEIVEIEYAVLANELAAARAAAGQR